MTRIPLTSVYQTQILKTFIDSPGKIFPNAFNVSTETTSQTQRPCVVTGQQIGLFGGPLYTILKIGSTRAAADELSKVLGVDVDAVFWLEDNDHDAREAASVWLPSEGAVKEFTIWDGSDERKPVSTRTLSERERHRVEELTQKFDGRFAEEIRQTMSDIYRTSTSWSDSFLQVITPFIDAWNITVIRGSDVIATGVHDWLVRKDLLEEGALESILKKTSAALEQNGYKAQAPVPDVLFFLHEDSGRQKLTRNGDRFETATRSYTPNELLTILNNEPKRFSPSVLARPLVQDSCLNTVAAVLGPAEIGYHAQLTDIYPQLGLRQPMILCRHSACILDSKTERDLVKIGREAVFFFQHWEEVERQITDSVTQDSDLPSENTEMLQQLLAPYKTSAQQIDVTLVKSVEAVGSTIRTSLEHLDGKLKTALKRKQAQVFDKARTLWWSLYPAGSPNERILPLSIWMSRIGFDTLRIIVEKICEGPRDEFAIVGPSDGEMDRSHAE